jgi:hypothetical protein
MADYTATRWYASLKINGKVKNVQGGSYSPLDVSLESVDPATIQTFQIVHNDLNHTYRAPTNTWYIDRIEIPRGSYVYPTTYALVAGTLTVDFDFDTGLLRPTFESYPPTPPTTEV